VAIAGAAAGLAVGAKLSAVAPALALALVAAVSAGRARRLRATAAFLAPLVATGGFWYLRNLVRTGNPLPYVDLPGLPSPDLPLTDRFSWSIAHYAGDGHVWSEFFGPGLHSGLGPAWYAILALAAAGAVAAIARPRAAAVRGIGIAALLAVAAYAVTPLTAGGPPGRPVLFVYTLRYLVPALAVGLVLFAAADWGRRRAAATAALVVAFIATRVDDLLPPFHAGPAVAVTAAGLGAWVVLRWAPRRLRPLVAFAVAAASLVVVYAWGDSYLDRRYADRAAPLGPEYAWASGVHHARIAIAGFYTQYPLYGRDLTNRVQYVGAAGAHGGFAPLASCAAWRRALDAGRYRYVVTAPVRAQKSGVLEEPGSDVAEPPEAAWTRSSPAATAIVQSARNATVFRLAGPLGTTGCPR
jgi:hypothetical protein